MKKIILKSMGIMTLTSCVVSCAMAEAGVGAKNEAVKEATPAAESEASGTSSGGAVAPTLKISGNTIQNVYVFTQKKHNNGKGKGLHFANDVSDLLFLVSGMTSNGIAYKYKIAMDAYANSSPFVSQNYAEFNTAFGTIQLGNAVGPEDTMIKDAGSIVTGTGAFDGGYYKVFNLSALAMRGNDNIGDTGSATKFVYYTPEIFDFKFGVAYTPDTTHLGDSKADTNTVKGNGSPPGQRSFFPTNIIGLSNWAFGAAFKKALGSWEVNLTGSYIYAGNHLAATDKTVAPLKLKHTSAYQLGTVIGYKFENGRLIQIGAGYLNNGKSALPKTATPNATAYGASYDGAFGDLYQGTSGRACNFGAAYTMGVYKFSGAYQHTHRRTDAIARAKNEVYSLAADVNPVAGLKFFSELNYVMSKSNNAAVTLASNNAAKGPGSPRSVQAIPNIKNKGTVFIMGTKISF